MVFLIHQTLCEDSIFSTVAPGPPLRPGHLFISLPTRVSAGARVAVLSRQEVHEHGRPTAPPPRGHTLSPEGSPGAAWYPSSGVTHAPSHRRSFVFQPRAQTVPSCVCVHTRACRWRGRSHCLAGSPGPCGVGRGEFPWPEVLCSLRRGVRTPRGDGTAVDAPGTSPGCSEHVLLHKVTYVHKVTSGQANPSPLLSPERDVHLGPSYSPIFLLPVSPPTPPTGHPACYRILPPRLRPGSPVGPSAHRAPPSPLTGQRGLPSSSLTCSLRPVVSGLQGACRAPRGHEVSLAASLVSMETCLWTQPTSL